MDILFGFAQFQIEFIVASVGRPINVAQIVAHAVAAVIAEGWRGQSAARLVFAAQAAVQRTPCDQRQPLDSRQKRRIKQVGFSARSSLEWHRVAPEESWRDRKYRQERCRLARLCRLVRRCHRPAT